MTPSLQPLDTDTITQLSMEFKASGPFHEEQVLMETQTRIRALQARWKQVKNLSETELVLLWNDTRKELFPCGCVNSQCAFRRINNVSAINNLFTEPLQF